MVWTASTVAPSNRLQQHSYIYAAAEHLVWWLPPSYTRFYSSTRVQLFEYLWERVVFIKQFPPPLFVIAQEFIGPQARPGSNVPRHRACVCLCEMMGFEMIGTVHVSDTGAVYATYSSMHQELECLPALEWRGTGWRWTGTGKKRKRKGPPINTWTVYFESLSKKYTLKTPHHTFCVREPWLFGGFSVR